MLRMNEVDTDGDTLACSPGGELPYAVEHALLFGLGSAGNAVLRELCVWQREWSQWRDVLLPKFIAAFPGKRPAAGYICGEWPMRPMDIELPLSSPLRQSRCVYVNCGADGFTYADLPKPYQPDEAMHLYAAGVIEAEELRRYRGYGRSHGLRKYLFEVGR